MRRGVDKAGRSSLWDDIERFGQRVIAVEARADCDIGRVGFGDCAETPDRHFAEAFRRREEIPIRQHALAHRGVSDVVGGEREEIEFETDRAWREWRGRNVHEARVADVGFADVKFAHRRLRCAVVRI